MERTSGSGFPIDPVYDASKLTDFQPEAKLGRPGEYPFTRAVYLRMHVDRPWTMRQYAGFVPPAAGLRLTAQHANSYDEALALPSPLTDRIREIDEGDRIVVGVNKCVADGEEPYQPLRADVTLGEVCDALRVVWGEYHPSEM